MFLFSPPPPPAHSCLPRSLPNASRLYFRPGGGFYQLQGPASGSAQDGPRQHTRQPIVTGTSILAIKFKGGVMMAADTLGSYGSLARFRDERRLKEVGEHTIIGGSGDIADYHHILHMLEDLETENVEWDDGQSILPKSVHAYMTRVLYNRRTKMNPLWNTVVVGGFADGEGYLGYCDKIGVAYNDDVVATGYGGYIALPIMRGEFEANPEMTGGQARSLLERCLKVMYYRDARSLNRFQIATSTAAGVTIMEPETQETKPTGTLQPWSKATSKRFNIR